MTDYLIKNTAGRYFMTGEQLEEMRDYTDNQYEKY